MSVTFATTTTDPLDVDADLLALPIFAERELGPGAVELGHAMGGLDGFLESAGFSGKVGETVRIPPPESVAADSVLLVGVGPSDEIDARALRRAAAAVARQARRVRVLATALVAAGGGDRAAAQAVGEGLVLGSYQFLHYKGEGEPSALEQVVAIGPGGRRALAALERGGSVADATCWARDLVNEPAGSLGPTDVVAAAKRRLQGRGVRITVFDEARIKKEELGGLLGVNAGSDRPPRLLKVVYAPANARSTIALVGKGITFDSGGLSLKPAKGMETMKTDMGGGAAVLAAMSALKDLGVRSKVVAWVPLTENMPSGRATKPGDVLTIRDGTTVEVLNTDAEGRLVLADALALAVEEEPDAIVDLATLTGACMVALGDQIAGLMGNDDGLVEQVEAAAARAGERVWHLPLPPEYRKQLDSEVADLQNIGGQYGGALTAALFLESFVDDVPWAHLDIAGPARAAKDDGELTRGGTGFGVRTLLELVDTFRRPRRGR